jgi:DNA-binding response OmpR family regulator
MAARILVVEDEEHLASGIKFNLELDGYEVEVVGDGTQALARLAAPACARTPFDLVILDVMLPGLDGFSVAARLRQSGDFTAILMLTAKSLPEDVIHGLEAGADDYLAKPFDLGVFLARVRGLLRRRDWARGGHEGEGGGSEADALQGARIGQAEVDFRRFEIRVGDAVQRLTLLEAMLLRLLVLQAGRVVSKGEILERVWNLSPETETRAVDNFIVRLRRYLRDDPKHPRHLQTVRGAGYKLLLE